MQGFPSQAFEHVKGWLEQPFLDLRPIFIPPALQHFNTGAVSRHVSGLHARNSRVEYRFMITSANCDIWLRLRSCLHVRTRQTD